MVRAFIKGGVWKNSEDEILKAAVQKYGKQQWARVASLLNRKTAKQCKARWHEWLDPSVRKVEWSREEEEKLLHLAKLMPAQWKTIGPLVGRTATQCQEHYEKLLDEAAATPNSGNNVERVALDAAAGIRHQPLRAGQIESHPETKPARPDPIDMDEDEIEMLQEARARLANTQGKKAKRKAREKMLAQAKRMADLQKRRELKQAGLISGQAKRNARARLKGGDVDLGVEIPFHKPVPAGFHDMSGEVKRSETLRLQQAKEVNFQQHNEQQYRSRDDEQQKARKNGEARLRALEKSNMSYVVAHVSRTNDPLNIRKRGRLLLPMPSVSDRELQILRKMEEVKTKPVFYSSSTEATSTLLADHSARIFSTPIRTHKTVADAEIACKSTQDNILREAGNLRLLERGQTPLLGGDNPTLDDQPMDRSVIEYSNVQMKSRPAITGIPVSSIVARDHYGLNKRPQSELREGFGDDNASVETSTFANSTIFRGSTSAMSIREIARAERRASKLARYELEDALATLPAPQFEYELEVPIPLGNTDKEGKFEKMIEKNVANICFEEKHRRPTELETLYEAKSTIIKRHDLPRSIPDNEEISGNVVKVTKDSEAEVLIDEERSILLKHDAFVFPVEVTTATEGGAEVKKKERQSPQTSTIAEEKFLEYISEKELDAAKERIRRQFNEDMEVRVRSVLSIGRKLDKTQGLVQTEMMNSRKISTFGKEKFITNTWKDVSKDNQSIQVSMDREYACYEDANSTLHKRNTKLETKLTLLKGGFVKRAQNSCGRIFHSYQDFQNAQIDTAVYRKLSEQEEVGASFRIHQLQSDIQELKQDEERLKEIYKSVCFPY